MTDSASNNTDALVTAYVYGELSADAKVAFEDQMQADPALAAEVDGLMAMRSLLDADAAFGEEQGLDTPPPHLFDAILKDEAIARSPMVKAAVAQRAAPPQGGLLSKLSTWLVGGGALAGAAALLFFVVARQGGVDGVAAPANASAKAFEEAPKTTAAPAPKRKAKKELASAQAAPKVSSASGDSSALNRQGNGGEGRLGKDALAPPATKAKLAARGSGAGGGGVSNKNARGGLGMMNEDGVLGRRDANARSRSDRESDRRSALEERKEKEGAFDFGTTTGGTDKLASGSLQDAVAESSELVPEPERKPVAADRVLKKEPKSSVPPADAPLEPSASLGGVAAVTESVAEEAEADDDMAPIVPLSRGTKGAAPKADGASPPPPPRRPRPVSARPPALNQKTAEYARRQREAAAKKRPRKKAKSKQGQARDDFKQKASRESRLRRTEQTIMAAATELSAKRSATALSLFERAEFESSGLKEVGLGPVLGQMQALMQMGRQQEALALAVKGERASKGTVSKDDVIATGARIATKLQNRTRARALWRQVLTSRRFKLEAQRALKAMSFDADMYEAPAAPASARERR